MDIFMMEVLSDGLEGVLGLLSAFFTAAKAAAAMFTMLGLPGSTCGIFASRGNTLIHWVIGRSNPGGSL